MGPQKNSSAFSFVGLARALRHMPFLLGRAHQAATGKDNDEGQQNRNCAQARGNEGGGGPVGCCSSGRRTQSTLWWRYNRRQNTGAIDQGSCQHFTNAVVAAGRHGEGNPLQVPTLVLDHFLVLQIDPSKLSGLGQRSFVAHSVPRTAHHIDFCLLLSGIAVFGPDAQNQIDAFRSFCFYFGSFLHDFLHPIQLIGVGKVQYRKRTVMFMPFPPCMYNRIGLVGVIIVCYQHLVGCIGVVPMCKEANRAASFLSVRRDTHEGRVRTSSATPPYHQAVYIPHRRTHRPDTDPQVRQVLHGTDESLTLRPTCW